jgi:hypothetical protein
MSAILDIIIGEVAIAHYKPSDAQKMSFRDKRLQQYFLSRNPNYFNNLKNAYTLFSKGDYCGIFGVNPMYFPFVETFFFAAEKLDQLFCKDFYRACLLIREDLRRKYDRIQATTVATNVRDVRFLEKLGFQRECLMKKYGVEGEDHYLYSLVSI